MQAGRYRTGEAGRKRRGRITAGESAGRRMVWRAVLRLWWWWAERSEGEGTQCIDQRAGAPGRTKNRITMQYGACARVARRAVPHPPRAFVRSCRSRCGRHRSAGCRKGGCQPLQAHAMGKAGAGVEEAASLAALWPRRRGVVGRRRHRLEDDGYGGWVTSAGVWLRPAVVQTGMAAPCRQTGACPGVRLTLVAASTSIREVDVPLGDRSSTETFPWYIHVRSHEGLYVALLLGTVSSWDPESVLLPVRIRKLPT